MLKKQVASLFKSNTEKKEQKTQKQKNQQEEKHQEKGSCCGFCHEPKEIKRSKK